MLNDLNALIGFEIELKLGVSHYQYLLTKLTT